MLTQRTCCILSITTLLCLIACETTYSQTRNSEVIPVTQIRFASISTGSDTTGDGSQANPWKTLSFALLQITDASELNRYEIRAASGTYKGDVTLKAWVSLLGGYEPNGWVRDVTANETVIKRQIAGVNMASHSLLDGFHITGGTPLIGKGISCSKVTSATVSNNLIDSLVTGIYCEKGSTVAITGNKILNNRQEGISCDNSSPQVASNIIQGNTQEGVKCVSGGNLFLSGNHIVANGRGITITQVTSVITSNMIEETYEGTGINATESILHVYQNLIVNNHYSGIYLLSSTASIVSNTICGNLTPTRGGGAYILSSSATLISNVIKRNASISSDGGGIYCVGSTVSIERNTITNNTAGFDGGGIKIVDCPASLDRNLIHENTSIRQGGGIHISQNQPVVIRNTSITGNSTGGYGGGIYIEGPRVYMTNNTIAGNYNGGIFLLLTTNLCRIYNCIISGNSAQGIGKLYSYPPEVLYSVLQEPHSGEGNILSSNPMFMDTTLGDYHLRDGSPAIDRGSISLATPLDMDGNPRPGGDGKVDVGAYETSDEYLPGDPRDTPTRWYVKSDAPDNGDGKSWETAVRTIEAALNLREASDTIWVASGTYQGHWILPPGVALISGFSGDESSLEERDLRIYRATLQNASTGYSVVYLGSKSLLDGFTVTGGQSGGVSCDYATPATVTNNIITGNHNESYGGGLIINHSTGLIANNVISRNISASQGGGISSRYSTSLFYGNTIVDNTAATTGGAVQFSFKMPTFKNCILWGNTTSTITGGTGTVLPITYSDIQGGYTGDGNIDADPLFVDSTMDDYHLPVNSPCIGKGIGPLNDSTVPPFDYEGDVREGATCDMGADESTGPTIIRKWIEY